jgi:hypothetical protein
MSYSESHTGTVHIVEDGADETLCGREVEGPLFEDAENAEPLCKSCITASIPDELETDEPAPADEPQGRVGKRRRATIHGL